MAWEEYDHQAVRCPPHAVEAAEVSKALLMMQKSAAHQPSQVIDELHFSFLIFSSDKVCHLRLLVQPDQISLRPSHVFRDESTVAPTPCQYSIQVRRQLWVVFQHQQPAMLLA